MLPTIPLAHWFATGAHTTPATMARILVALTLLALSMPACLADCPDKSIACRIPKAEERLQVGQAVDATPSAQQAAHNVAACKVMCSMVWPTLESGLGQSLRHAAAQCNTWTLYTVRVGAAN